MDIFSATLLNGMLAHALELDDVHTGSKSHVGAVVIPAAWTMADALGLPGNAFLEAVIVGYEAMAPVGMAMDVASNRRRGWHATGVIGTFGAAAAVYGVKTALDFYRADRMLGATWLVADILFAGAAWALARRAWSRSEEDREAGRERWIWALAAFAVWLPGARIIARACMAVELPGVLLYFFVGAWTAAAGWLFWRLWRERGHGDIFPVSGSRPALAAGAWRAAGALLLVLALGEDLNDVSAAGIFSAAIDWPSRALFAWAFLTSRLKV